MVAHFYPRLVQLHNYRCGYSPCMSALFRQGILLKAFQVHAQTHNNDNTCSSIPIMCFCIMHCPRSSANALQQKMYNWNTLNQKVFRKLGFQLSKQDCEDIANAVPGAIERVLKLARIKLASYTGGDLGRWVAVSYTSHRVFARV